MAKRGRPRKDAAQLPGDEDPRGWDPLAQGKARYSGMLPLHNGCSGSRVLPYTSYDEFVAAVVSQMVPGLTAVGRGDLSDTAATRYGITGPEGARWAIPYTHSGEVHSYLPDYVARGHPGAFAGRAVQPSAKPTATYVIEAGRLRRKATEKELAKLVTARHLVRVTGGELVIVSSERVVPRWIRNVLLLHLYGFDYRGPEDLRAYIRGEWERRDLTIRALTDRLRREERPEVITAAGWAAAGDLARRGHLAGIDLERDVMGLDSRVRAKRQGSPPILPSGLITDLDELVALANQLGGPSDDWDEEGPTERPSLEGSVIDPAAIDDPAERDRFERRLAAAAAHDEEALSLAAAAARFGLPVRDFQLRYARSARYGQAAFYSHASYTRPYTSLPDQMVSKIRSLYMRPTRPGVTEIAEAGEIQKLAEELGRQTPSRRQIQTVVRHLEAVDHKVRQARAGRRSLPLVVRGRSVDVESRPGFLVELDEETFDALAVTLEGEEVTVRLHVGVLIDVATRDILSVVVSPKALDEWDLRRLLLRAMLPKDLLKARFGFQNPWPTVCIPVIVSTDNGRIMTSRLSIQSAGRVPFVLQFVPFKDPHCKPYVEAFFAGLKHLFEHRLIVTTGSSPEARGAHDPAKEAIRRAITPQALEAGLVRHLVDVYRRRWHRGLRERTWAAWDRAVARLGVRTWQGTPDELRRALKRDEGTRLVVDSAVSYKGRWYGDELLKPWGTDPVQIVVDDDDLRTLDVQTKDGVFLGVVRNDELSAWGRPVSRWELELKAEVEKELAKAANAEAVANAQANKARIESDEKAGARARARRRHERERADETATQASRDALAGAPPPTPRVLPKSLTAPVADDETEYPTLDDLEVTDDAA